MFVRNLLQPGDFVELVPMGMNVTLRYGDEGLLESVAIGHDLDNLVELLPEATVQAFRDRVIMPVSIPVKGGTTWVRGVITYPDLRPEDGELPAAAHPAIYRKIEMGVFNDMIFMAMDVVSLATTFSGIQSIRSWLQMNKFHVLPAILMPAKIDEATILSAMKLHLTDYLPVVQTYAIYRASGTVIQDSGVTVETVITSHRHMDDHGIFYLEIVFDKLGVVKFPYGVAIKFNMKAGTRVYFNEAGHPFFSTYAGVPMPNTFTCPLCGNTICAVPDGDTICTELSCASHLYAQYLHFCNTVHLKPIGYTDVARMIADGEVMMLSDVVEKTVPENYKVLVTPTAFLSSLIPSDQLRDRSFLSKFTGNCNNSMETISYFVSNPAKIATVLDMERQAVDQMMTWCSRPENVLLFNTMLDLPFIKVEIMSARFDGEPIFRGMTLTLTGAFRHGNLDDMFAILKSFDATVVTELRDTTTVVILGDLQEGVNGRLVKQARKKHIPVVTESQFFEKYNLDADLKENLQ